ncbi:hypothetical protein [Bartonella capreoli]|uniref:hypothetical protein n=1 Tax=Bartonella capreoli TaxID=155192 RepID=UPI001ABD1F69|nr:hypothetical protein [Bartonella capreoli]
MITEVAMALIDTSFNKNALQHQISKNNKSFNELIDKRWSSILELLVFGYVIVTLRKQISRQ